MIADQRRGFRYMEGGSLDGPVDVIDMMMQGGAATAAPWDAPASTAAGGKRRSGPEINNKHGIYNEKGELLASPSGSAGASVGSFAPGSVGALCEVDIGGNEDQAVLESCGATVHRMIGAGNFGSVFACSIDGLEEELAVKVVKTKDTQASRELKLCTCLEHPHLVRLLRVVCETPMCLAYEMCRGGTLQELLHRSSLGAAMTVQQRLMAVLEVVSAVTYLHGRGVIHRDIKPPNIFLAEQPSAKGAGVAMPAMVLGDLGLARFLPEDEAQPIMTQCIGTVRYMAPEVVSESEYGPPADVFSLGMLLYEVSTGAVPFGSGIADQQVLLKIMRGMRPSMDLLPSSAGPDLATTVQKAWDQDPEKRLGAKALELHLGDLLSNAP